MRAAPAGGQRCETSPGFHDTTQPKDGFARPDLLADTVARLSQATLHVIDGADHGLRVRGRAAEDVVRELADVAAAWTTAVGAP
ncbi:MAG: hypothetical protein QN174_02375 [Armatimonadota bacterium]|nr:hypothetical protein [Armatimonadota bacterium]MDR7423328.1 hypothetical protein [Armatimonadota bacterium]MDR7456153.1 hypothetical protein [Armatimonadota bacterium]MDR7495794.1 hypothetical protein [Armatimonadota bacterium]MDR7510826.1 hypothetical protein [Armatimonadota bacterium]